MILLSAWAPKAFAKNARTPKNPDYKHQIEQMEELWRIAQLNGDVTEMDKILSEDYVGITMNGQVVTKMQQLDRMKNRQLVLTKIDLSDVKVKLIGSRAAIVTCQADVQGTNDGAVMHGTYRYTRVYARMPNGMWKITNFEATRVGSRRDERNRDHAEQSAQPSP